MYHWFGRLPTPLDLIKLLYEDRKNEVIITAIPRRDSVTRTDCLFVTRGRDPPYSIGLGASYRSVELVGIIHLKTYITLFLKYFTRHKAVTIGLILIHGLLMLAALCESYSMPAKCDIIHIYSNCNVSTAQYFGANIVLLAISAALTVLVLNIHHRGSRGNPVPAMVQMVVLDWLARILGMGKCVHGKKR